ncbi:hypothetical protein Vi05172_g4984 [Venturia inaequalis]|nr:hypothetical protein Vi05172_g4984 [Venturia inaequalis]
MTRSIKEKLQIFSLLLLICGWGSEEELMVPPRPTRAVVGLQPSPEVFAPFRKQSANGLVPSNKFGSSQSPCNPRKPNHAPHTLCIEHSAGAQVFRQLAVASKRGKYHGAKNTGLRMLQSGTFKATAYDLPQLEASGYSSSSSALPSPSSPIFLSMVKSSSLIA